MKQPILLFLAILLCYSAVAVAQPTITFSPSSGNTLTYEDVNNIIAANGLNKESEFYAVIENAAAIGAYAFLAHINLLSVDLGSVIFIHDYAFGSCSTLTTISSDNVIEIREQAFFHCTNLEYADFPNATTLGRSAFFNCSSLSDIYFPEVTTFGLDDVFKDCINLKVAIFPKLLIISDSAFLNCTSLETIRFPAATRIRHSAFRNCSSIKFIDEHCFPNVTILAGRAFHYCTGLTKIY